MEKVWTKLPPPPAGFGDTLGLPAFQAHLLYNRGIRRREEADLFLAADERLLNDPLILPDMDLAVARLTRALRSGESIGIFGDFDTDGVTGTALLTRALRDVGATVVTYLPDRVEEGHGLNEQAIRMLHGRSVSLIVTVDCGASSVDEVAQAASLGIDTIVTDHHSMVDHRPDAYALINPKRGDSSYPYEDLTGAGMSFKLAEALYAALGRPRPDHLLELAALGTVADVGPLTGENRYLVKKGLERLNSTESLGIRALAARAGLELGFMDTESLSFGLIPRLNAAGRLAHAGASLDLLTATSAERVGPLVDDLERKNDERRSMTAQSVAEAQQQLDASLESRGMPAFVIVQSPHWIPGILGLVAARLADYYKRPAAAVGVQGDVARGSVRSIPGFDVIEALQSGRDLFTRFGGHPQAAGFTVPASSLPLLEERLIRVADERLQGADLTPRILIDCEVSPALVAGEIFSFIQSLAPFGEGNPAPVFLTRNARVVDSRRVGSDGSHLKLRLYHSGSSWDAIAFRQGDKIDAARQGIDLVYTVDLNHWGGAPRLQLKVLDLRPARQGES